eukprot:13738963-Heterocapsa_arctica.AAC.1
MENVHDKAPVRKKEDKQVMEEIQRKFQGRRPGLTGSTISSTKKEADGSAPDAANSPPHISVGRDWSERR